MNCASLYRCNIYYYSSYFTHWSWIDEGNNSKRQAAAQQGEDGVAKIVFDWRIQRPLTHIHIGLGHDDTWLCLVLLLSIHNRSSLQLVSIALLQIVTITIHGFERMRRQTWSEINILLMNVTAWVLMIYESQCEMHPTKPMVSLKSTTALWFDTV